MIIDCCADLHGFYPELEGGDLLIVAGDLTAMDTEREHRIFQEWIGAQDYDRKIFIGGNHDNWLQKNADPCPFPPGAPGLDVDGEYLCDSGTEFVLYPELSMMKEGQVYHREKVKIWGSPWTKRFDGMNPKAMAFTVDTDEELAEKWMLIPRDTNVLITHSPSFGNYDWTKNPNGTIGPSLGSPWLWMRMLTMVPNLKLHVTGHIHEAYGHCKHKNGIHLVNASHVNQRYEPVNKPIRVVL